MQLDDFIDIKEITSENLSPILLRKLLTLPGLLSYVPVFRRSRARTFLFSFLGDVVPCKGKISGSVSDLLQNRTSSESHVYFIYVAVVWLFVVCVMCLD